MGKTILVLGAGRSSSWLLRYLSDNSEENGWKTIIADTSLANAREKASDKTNIEAVELDAENESDRRNLIGKSDLVISLLPPDLHFLAAEDCVMLKKNMVTASYVSPQIKELDAKARESGVIILMEMGLDPGIDHLSAMKVIDEIRGMCGTVRSFKSHTGGLVAPEFDTNPWNYKFTWNPRNVVTAGQATAKYLDGGKIKHIPPRRIFSQTEDLIVDGLGEFEAYPNRDSLGYITPYHLESAETVLRGTIRRKGFCRNWDLLVKIGWTDDSFLVENPGTYRELTDSFLPESAEFTDPEDRLANLLQIAKTSEEFKKLVWLGILDDEQIPLKKGTPAKILQELLESKWQLLPGEKDMIVMIHQIAYKIGEREHRIQSSLVVKGEDETYTAMAKTVGLPLGIAAKLILNGKLKAKGIQIPVTEEFYVPVLEELESHNIVFKEEFLD